MIDTHTHLYLPEYEGAGCAAVQRALDAGVEHMILPNVDLTTAEPMLQLASQWPGVLSCAMGLHPTEIGPDWQSDLDRIFAYFDTDTRFCAVGEVGIDLYWDATHRDAQMQAFDLQLGKAAELELPVIIHCREGLDEVLEVLSDHSGVPAVFHSFGGNTADVERIRSLGDYYFGINGIVTFKNSSLRHTLPAIGLDRILLETDSPYLAPVPMRGKRNESSYLPHIAAHIAQSLDTTAAAVSHSTSANARRLFKL